MEPIVQFESGQEFGDLALLNNKGRAGTVVCLTDCFFAVINSDSYEKLIRKEKLQQQDQSIQFLRQIPYMNFWTYKDTEKLYNYCVECKVDLLNKVIV